MPALVIAQGAARRTRRPHAALSLPRSELLRITSPSFFSEALDALVSHAHEGRAGGGTTVRAGALRLASGRCVPGLERSRDEASALGSRDPPGPRGPGGWWWSEEALTVTRRAATSRADTSVLTKCPRSSQPGSGARHPWAVAPVPTQVGGSGHVLWEPAPSEAYAGGSGLPPLSTRGILDTSTEVGPQVDLLPKKHVMVKWLIRKWRVRCTRGKHSRGSCM